MGVGVIWPRYTKQRRRQGEGEVGSRSAKQMESVSMERLLGCESLAKCERTNDSTTC